MKIYDEITKEEITFEIDSSKGYTYDGKIKNGHVDDTYEVMGDSVSEDWPDGMKKIIPGYDTFEDCKYYHAYTEKELQIIQDEKDRKEKEEQERLAAQEAEMKARKEAEEAAAAAAKAQAEKEANWNAKIDRIDDIDAQITYTAMMTDTLLTEDTDNSDESDTSDSSSEDNNDSSAEEKSDNVADTKEDTNNE